VGKRACRDRDVTRARARVCPFIVVSVFDECRKNGAGTSEYAIAGRIRALVDEGKLEAQGNLSRWRYSEVRLPE
jgi:hypothetical protein